MIGRLAAVIGRSAAVIGGAIALSIALAGCSSGRRDAGPPPGIGSSDAGPPAVATPSPRLSDPRWIRARDEDPLERARLAEEVGAAELLAGVEDGGVTEVTALSALPFAGDGEIALGRLGEIAAADPARRGRVLPAILGVAGQPRRPREALDPDGVKRCGEALLAIAADSRAAVVDRAAAVSAARALAERGYVDPRRIPADLDPR